MVSLNYQIRQKFTIKEEKSITIRPANNKLRISSRADWTKKLIDLQVDLTRPWQ